MSTPFLPVTLEGWFSVAANTATIAAALYAGFKALPQLTAALATLARREVTSAANIEAAEAASGPSASTSESPDQFDQRRVAAVFALFERWKALRPRLRDEAHAYPDIADRGGYKEFVERMLGYFDLIMLNRPDTQADHWRKVLLGELIHHQAILKSEFSKLSPDRYGRDTRAIVDEAIRLGWR